MNSPILVSLSRTKHTPKYGPLAIISVMQAAHGTLLSQHRWPALAASLPQSNTAPVSIGTLPPSQLNGRSCFRCQGDHLIRDCPVPAPSDSANGGTNPRVRTALAAWKYIKPNDVTVPRVDTQGKIWKFCSKCKCRATNHCWHLPTKPL